MDSKEKKIDPEQEKEKTAETEAQAESAETKADESENQNDSQTEENSEGAGKNEKTEPLEADGQSAETDNENSEPENHSESESKSGKSDLKAQLLAAQAQLAAFKCGVRSEAVEDAVCLAINDAKKKGEVTQESIADALSGVLNRHPDWKNFYEPSNDFRIGADGMSKANSSIDEISQIFGNKEE